MREWRRLIRAAILAAALSQAGAAAASGPDIAFVQAWVDGTGTLEARFEQELLDEDERVLQASSGRFRLLRPGRFRWDYEAPFPQAIVADGQKLWIYDEDLEQVTVRDLAAGLSGTPAKLLSGEGAIADGYSELDRFERDGLGWIELVPATTDGDFRRVKLAFGGDELRVMELVDGLGQTTRIRFLDIERDTDLKPGDFVFSPPPQADVIVATGT